MTTTSEQTLTLIRGQTAQIKMDVFQNYALAGHKKLHPIPGYLSEILWLSVMQESRLDDPVVPSGLKVYGFLVSSRYRLGFVTLISDVWC